MSVKDRIEGWILSDEYPDQIKAGEELKEVIKKRFLELRQMYPNTSAFFVHRPGIDTSISTWLSDTPNKKSWKEIYSYQLPRGLREDILDIYRKYPKLVAPVALEVESFHELANLVSEENSTSA